MDPQTEQPAMSLRRCKHCPNPADYTRTICFNCYSLFVTGLRLAVKSSALTDWQPNTREEAWLNHSAMMRNYALAQQWIEWDAFVRWPVWVDLIMARKIDEHPEYWEAER